MKTVFATRPRENRKVPTEANLDVCGLPDISFTNERPNAVNGIRTARTVTVNGGRAREHKSRPANNESGRVAPACVQIGGHETRSGQVNRSEYARNAKKRGRRDGRLVVIFALACFDVVGPSVAIFFRRIVTRVFVYKTRASTFLFRFIKKSAQSSKTSSCTLLHVSLYGFGNA